MDLVLIIQIAFIFIIFGLTLACVLLPLKIVSRGGKGTSSSKSQRVISFCNCFSGGVFLGTCYLQLVPFIQDKFDQVFKQLAASWMEYSGPVTQLSVMLGFFLILLVEQVVRVCQETAARHQKPQHHHGGEMVRLPAAHCASESDEEDDLDIDLDTDDSEDVLLGDTRTRQGGKNDGTNGAAKVIVETGSSGDHGISNKPKFCKKRVRIRKPNRHDGDHADDHLGHGHSHLADIVKEDFGLRSLLLLFALSLHSLLEGMAQGLQSELYKAITLFIGIAVHEVLVAFAVGVNLAQQKLRVATVVKLGLLFSLTIPVGMALGMGLNGLRNLAGQTTSAIIQGLTAGTFVYVTFLEILPSEINSKKDRLLKVFFIFFGFSVIACLRFSLRLGHETVSDQLATG